MPSAVSRHHSFLDGSWKTLCLAALLLAACGGDGGGSPIEDADDAGTEHERSPATTDDEDAGEAEDAEVVEDAESEPEDAGTADAAPSAPDAGVATDAAAPQPDAQQPASVDLSGTWIAKIETLATESVPLVGEIDVQLELAIRLVVTHTANKLSAKFDICQLATKTVPDAEVLVVSFPSKLIATLQTSASSNVTMIAMGDMVPLPQLTIRSGIDASQKPVDADADSNPGVTVPANIGGILPLSVYTGLTIDASITSRLTAADKVTGTATFSVTGQVFGSDNPLLADGTLTVAPKAGPVPLTATRLAGDVPCSEVVTRLR